jgi:serine/threonine-protein kinase RsbW
MDIRILEPDFYTHCAVIPSDSAEAFHLQQHILHQLRLLHYDEADIFAVRLALEEVFVNAIKHGNKCDPHKKVHIHYRIDPDGFYIHVRDEGPGFSPEAIPDPRRREHLEEPCGRGLLLIKHYMNEVHYLENGNVVVMVKQKKPAGQ